MSGAQMSDLDLILFTHFHVDHSGDFAALIKSSWFEERKRPLPIYGPGGNDFMPSTVEFVNDFSSQITVGLLLIALTMIFTLFGKVKPEHSERAEVFSLYWHFVDVVWVIVFTVVYIIGR